MKPFRKRGKGSEETKERFVSYNTDRAGCEIHGGVWNEKSQQCDERHLIDPDRPGEIVVKEFDEVKKPADIGGVRHIEDEG